MLVTLVPILPSHGGKNSFKVREFKENTSMSGQCLIFACTSPVLKHSCIQNALYWRRVGVEEGTGVSVYYRQEKESKLLFLWTLDDLYISKKIAINPESHRAFSFIWCLMICDPVLGPGEATASVLCSVLCTSVFERHWGPEVCQGW